MGRASVRRNGIGRAHARAVVHTYAAPEASVVTITVRARDDLPFEASGVPVTNTGELTATNQIAPADSSASVTPEVPLDLSTTTVQALLPDSGQASGYSVV